MRFVKLTQEQQEQLERLYRESDNHRERQRAQALLLSNRGYRMEQLADLFSADRDTVSNWFGSWEKQQEKQEISLLDQHATYGRATFTGEYQLSSSLLSSCIRSLLESFVKPFIGQNRIGGCFCYLFVGVHALHTHFYICG